MVKLVSIVVGGIILIGAFVYVLFFSDQNEDVIRTITPRETATEGVTIIAFGDSLTAGFGLPASESYPAQLEAVLKNEELDVRVVNAGVSGETTRGNLERATFIREQNPDVVLLGIGGNDALRSLPVADTKANIEATIEILQSGDNPPVVVLLQMQSPLNAGISYKREFDAMYPDIADKYNILLLPFLTLEVFGKPELKLNDGIHLNEAGYAQVIELYLKEPLTRVVEQLEG